MPGVFSRRRGSTGQAPHAAPVSSSATIAATSAFLKNSPSATSLSSAAAAAALRSHASSPEPVANVQTKRMSRKTSQSPNGRAALLSPPPHGQDSRPLVRRASSGSMTERTFRTPSPHGVSPNRARPAANDAPPVPQLRSPPPSRPASAASQVAPNGTSKQRPAKSQSLSILTDVQELEREGSQRSINFSRPMASPVDTPPRSPERSERPKTAGSWFSASKQTGVSARNSVTDRPRSSAGPSKRDSTSSTAQVPDSPGSRRKNDSGLTTPNQGKKLMSGTMKSGSKGTAVTDSPVQTASPSRIKPSEDQSVAASPEIGGTAEQNAQAASQPQDASPAKPRRPTNTLHKQPSTVMEEPELEDSSKTSQGGLWITMQSQKKPNGTQDQHLIARPRQASVAASVSSTGSPPQRPRQVSLEVPDLHARFASVIDDGSGARHNPPGRSVSPGKSAMKNSPASSIRGNSPVATFGSPVFKSPGSDTSDAISLTSQDGIRPKKRKGARVSFDENSLVNTAEAADATTLLPSQINRRSISPALSTDDEHMKPRPALPSFGSVRNGPKAPEVVAKPVAAISTPQKSALKSTEGVSSDHAIASILENEHQSKTEEVRSPLAPEVTSVEGTGYASDRAESSEEEVAQPKVNLSSPQKIRDAPAALAIGNATTPASSLGVPDIQIEPATPGAEETVSYDPQATTSPRLSNRRSVPGGWDDPDDDSEEEEVVVRASPVARVPQIVAVSPTMSQHEDESDSDASEAFSDAAEDPAEMEAFGYASLDAIVESPMPTPKKARKPSSLRDNVSAPPIELVAEQGQDDWNSTSAYWSQQKEQLQQLNTDEVDEQEDFQVQDEPRAISPEPEVAPAEIATVPEVAAVVAAAASLPAVSKPAQPLKPQPVSAARAKAPTQGGFRKSMRQPLADQALNPAPVVPKTRPNSLPVEARSAMQRKTMRQSGVAQVPSDAITYSKTRPAAQPAEQKHAMQRRTMRGNSEPAAATAASAPALAPAPAPVAKPRPLTIKPKDDSDSESSFRKRKAKPTGADGSGRYTMKKSMRSSSLDMERTARPSSAQGMASSRWSVRSASPVQSPQVTGGGLRQSLRGIPEGPTLRGDRSTAKTQKRQKSPSKFGMGGFSKVTKTNGSPPSASAPGKSGFRSRFADSDSEGDAESSSRPRAGGFRSRFADSDDEEEPASPFMVEPVQSRPPHRPVRHEDSSDDSDDDSPQRRAAKHADRPTVKPLVPSQADIDSAMKKARQNVAAMTGNEQLLAAPETPKGKVQKRVGVDSPVVHQSPARPQSPSVDANGMARRKGFFGSVFGRRNSSMSVSSMSSNKPAAAPPTPASVIAAGAAADNNAPASPASGRGKLQRRHTPTMSRANSSLSNTFGTPTISESTPPMPSLGDRDDPNWPLPPKVTADGASGLGVRPATSDGVAPSIKAKSELRSSMRPPAGRSQSGSAVDQEKHAVFSARTGKKKRFGKLRNFLGLDD